MDYLDLNNDKLVPVASELNVLLAEYHIYYQKLRNFHWNILGKNFFDLHEKFEEMYGDARIIIDEIGERILTLRYHQVSKLSDYLKLASIKESESLLTDLEMVKILLEDHEILTSKMRDVIKVADEANDEGTIDLIGAYIRELEKTSWMLNAWSKRDGNKLKTVMIEKLAQ